MSGWSIMALAAALASGAQAPAEEIRRFSGGYYDGLRFSIASETGQVSALLPAIPGASPVAVELAPAITGLLQAFRSGEPSDYASVSTSDAKIFLARGCLLPHEVGDGALCTPQPLYEVSFGEECTAGTPYQLPDRLIRIEWMCNGHFSFISWFSFNEGRVAMGAVKDAVAPQLLRQ